MVVCLPAVLPRPGRHLEPVEGGDLLEVVCYDKRGIREMLAYTHEGIADLKRLAFALPE